ncbi:MAG: FtsW/RodA/SpoVE family cell cycle protein [Victivallales bacterium]|nr:FtsW/RodA/SpoVE family cell cycle protein [Victivallales bacterium]
MELHRHTTYSHPGSSFSQILLWGCVIALCAYGVLFIYSTGYIADEYPVRPNWWRQLIWISFSAVACFMVASMNPKGLGWKMFVWGGYGASMLMLVFVLAFGRVIGGARRWLDIGPVMLQPAEFANFFMLMALCEAVVWQGKSWKWRLSKILGISLMIIIPLGLILAEPSFGNAFSAVPPIFCIIGIRYFNKRLWGATIIFSLLCLFLAWGTVMMLRNNPEILEEKSTIEDKTFISRFFHSYHSRRLKSYLTPQGDWNERQSVMTLASGGPFGKGYLQGTMKSLGYLPRTVAPTDFIFSVIGEELGFFTGCLPVLFLYMVLFSIGFHWASHTADEQACLRCTGVLMLLAIHVFVNVGMTVRLIPVIGLPLPLLSYGGSFTLMTFLCLGVLQASSHSECYDTDDGDYAAATNEWSLGRLLRIRVKAHQ